MYKDTDLSSQKVGSNWLLVVFPSVIITMDKPNIALIVTLFIAVANSSRGNEIHFSGAFL